MKLTASSTHWKDIHEEALVLPLFEGEKDFPITIPKKHLEYLKQVLRETEYKGADAATILVSLPGSRPVKGGRIPKLLLVGMGPKGKANGDSQRRAAAAASRTLAQRKITGAAFLVRGEAGDGLSSRDAGRAVVEGASFGAYRFRRYRKPEKGKDYKGLAGLHLLAGKGHDAAGLLAGGKEGLVVGEATSLARDMANSSPNDLYPESWAEWLAREAQGIPNLELRVLDTAAIREEKMGALLGVAQGSTHEPRFMVLEYRGGPAERKPIVFVGKGVTFDSGGLQIKEGRDMGEMCYDMSGGANVIAALLAVARLRLPVNLIGLIPSAENLPSGSAYRPSDVVVASDGTTIEIGHTDAEGRLLLAEALIYARRYDPEYVIDIATLTGAIVVALGDAGTGLFSDDDALANTLLETARGTGDRLWRMPLDGRFRQKVNSAFADIRNSAWGDRTGGAITASCFLQHFAKPYRWAHLDIAGTGWVMSDATTQERGATAWGVRLMVELARRASQIL